MICAMCVHITALCLSRPDRSQQVCKSPEKTKRRKLELSSQELVSSQTAMLQRQADSTEDEDGYFRIQESIRGNAAGPSSVNLRKDMSSGWRSNFRAGDESHGIDRPNTISMKSTSTGSSKRPTSPFPDDQNRSKKAKTSFSTSAPLGMCEYTQDPTALIQH